MGSACRHAPHPPARPLRGYHVAGAACAAGTTQRAARVGSAVDGDARRIRTASDGLRLAYGVSGRAAARQGGQLAHPSRATTGEPLLAPLARGLGEHHTLVRHDERGCGLSDRDVGETLSLAAAGGGPRGRRRRRRRSSGSRCSASRRAPRWRSPTPPATPRGQPPGALRRLRARAGRAAAPPAREARALVALIRLGWGRANAAFRRAFTRSSCPRERRSRWRGSTTCCATRRHRRWRPRTAEARGELDVAAAPRSRGARTRAARARRRGGAVRGGAADGRSDPRRALRAARGAQPHPARRRTGLGTIARGGARVPRRRGRGPGPGGVGAERARAADPGPRRPGAEQRRDRRGPGAERPHRRAPSRERVRQAAAVRAVARAAAAARYGGDGPPRVPRRLAARSVAGRDKGDRDERDADDDDAGQAGEDRREEEERDRIPIEPSTISFWWLRLRWSSRSLCAARSAIRCSTRATNASISAGSISSPSSRRASIAECTSDLSPASSVMGSL